MGFMFRKMASFTAGKWDITIVPAIVIIIAKHYEFFSRFFFLHCKISSYRITKTKKKAPNWSKTLQKNNLKIPVTLVTIVSYELLRLQAGYWSTYNRENIYSGVSIIYKRYCIVMKCFWGFKSVIWLLGNILKKDALSCPNRNERSDRSN